ncbi:valine--tRNA ligase [Kyrpidia spormannii]|uniref:Valine--tRNA ligase n=1 Tax=Kyrpidia spormannii TaxID=2055160 RepID=A0A2K8N4N4_9BACL|nr:valine--tRNA ligase [Kyrpidia spormannii]ATY84344.1 valine--tRNA ligase [Kyrpidia spormannii]
MKGQGGTARSDQLPTAFEPANVESKWYRFWMENGYFRAGRVPDGKPFTIVIPPPNVTGALHMGHALDFTLQDILIRFRRMQGRDALWLPGTDHAGIATQNRVEAMLLKETGQSRHDIGRDAFVEKVWEWKRQYGSIITNQIQALGFSCDWSRERFTMDEGLSRAVREVFVRLYERGLIYRGKYIINWCPRCRTALSDIEVEHEELDGALHYVRYPFTDGSGAVVVATTRPETMFGDVAVAVHPDDERYRAWIGKRVRLPLTDREIPVVGDSYVDPSFGTGCLKITPAHDPNDFEVGRRHGLPAPVVMNEDGTMNEGAGDFQGMDRFEARKAVVEALRREGYLERVEPHRHAVGHCQRCHTVVEPFLSEQWFVKMKPLAEPAIEAVKAGRVRFVPERFEKLYLHWVENVRDWCISRQLWWGHRIPAWYCEGCGETIVAAEDPEHCPRCGSRQLRQEEDVLDTWFSSALWPFSTMGWPEETEDLRRYFPTDVLVTGFDIIYFWVARMIFMSLAFTGEVPFRTVYIHGLVRDSQGRKMSKSLGNGIDPLDVVNKYGADALRFMLASGTAPGNDQRFYWEKVESARHFANKIWNAARFVLLNVDKEVGGDLKGAVLGRPEHWILHRLNETVRDVTEALENFDFGGAAKMVYDFVWGEFCDWYIEFSKAALYGGNPLAARGTRQVLVHVLDRALRLLHPFMPFLTEEIWQKLPGHGEALVAAEWPVPEDQYFDAPGAAVVEEWMELIRRVRNVRSEMNVPPGKPVPVLVRPADQEALRDFEGGEVYLRRLAGIDPLDFDLHAVPPSKSVTEVLGRAELFIPLEGVVDLEGEIRRLEKELEQLGKEVDRVRAKLDNPSFVAKAPPAVVEEQRRKEVDYAARRERVQARLKSLQRMI